MTRPADPQTIEPSPWAQRLKRVGHLLTRVQLFWFGLWVFWWVWRLEPEWVEARYHLALALARVGRDESSLEHLLALRGLDDRAERAAQVVGGRLASAGVGWWVGRLKRLGHVLTRVRLFWFGLWVFWLVWRLEPEWVEARYHLAMALARVGRNESSLEHLMALRGLDDRAQRAAQVVEGRLLAGIDVNAPIVTLVGRLVARWDPWAAVRVVDALLGSSVIHRAGVLAQVGIADRALEARLSTSPTIGMTWLEIGVLQRHLGRDHWALLAFDRASKTGAMLLAERFAFQVLIQNDHLEQARARLDRAFPQRFSSASERAFAAFNCGAFTVVVDELTTALAQGEGTAGDWLLLARALHRQDQFGWAFLAADRARAFQPDRGNARWLMAECLASASLGEAAIALLQKYNAIDRTDPDQLTAAGRLASKGGADLAALELAMAALHLEREHLGALELQLKALRALGRVDEFRPLVQRLKEMGSDDALLVLVRYHMNQDEPEAVLAAIQKITAPTAETRALEAQALIKLGRYTEAGAAVKGALEIDPRHRSARRWQAMLEGEARGTSLRWRPTLEGPAKVWAPKKGRPLHLVTNSLPHLLAGYTVRTHSIVRAELSAGLDPHVVTRSGFPGHPVSPIEELDGVPYHRLLPADRMPVRADAQLELYAQGAARVVEMVHPSLLHPASIYHNALVALSLRDRFDLPVVYEVRGFQEDSWVSRHAADVSISDRYLRRNEADLACMKEVDLVVTLADVMRDELVTRGVAPGKIRVVPNAVELDAFPVPERDLDLAGELGIHSDDLVVGYISSMVPYEGIRYLIEAMALLREGGYPVRGLLVGDGPERGALEDLTRELGVDEAVVFTGRVPHGQVLRYYGLIDVFVVPRTDDRVCHLVTPLKPFEAMATERALVVSGVSALREIVMEGDTGLVFRPEDPQDLAKQIASLADDPEERARLGRNARRWVAENRTWAENAQSYMEIYAELGAVSYGR